MCHTMSRPATSTKPWHGSPERSRRERRRKAERRRAAVERAGAGIAVLLIAAAVVGAVAPDSPREKHRPPEPLAREITIQEPAPEPRAYFDVPLSHDLQDVVFAEAERWGVPPALLLAMMDQESDYRTDAISSTGDYGIMQINEINHPRLRDELGITDFLDPEQSIACGAYMIGELLSDYDEDIHHALTAYNRGAGGAATYYRTTGTYETSYSTSIVEIYEQLEAETCR